MGLFDFFRRRFDEAPQPVDAANDDAGSPAVSDALDSGTMAEASGSAEPSPVERTAPPAWSMLPPLKTVSSPMISRSFDVEVGQRLRAHRSADDLLATHALGHTVNPSSIGVVGGLAQVVSRSAAVPTHAATGDQVLRRRVLRKAELAEADQGHPRWPVLARSFATSSGSTGSSGSFGSTGSLISRDVDDAGLGGNESSESTGSSLVGAAFSSEGDEAWLTGSTGGERSLPLAPPLGALSPISRLTDSQASSVSGAISRAVAPTVDAGRSTQTSLTLRTPDNLPTGSAGGGGAASVPLAPFRAPAPTSEGSSSSDAAPTVARSADLQAVARTLRRRSIVEMPSSSSVAASGLISTEFPSGVPSSSDLASSGSTEIARSSDDTDPAMSATDPQSPVQRSADVAALPILADVAESGGAGASAAVPTLGRRAGVGAPLSALPPTAVLRTPDEIGGPTPPWERASSLPLGGTSTPGSSSTSTSSSTSSSTSPSIAGASGGSSMQRSVGTTISNASGPASQVVLPTLSVVSRSSDGAAASGATALSNGSGAIDGLGDAEVSSEPLARPLLGDTESMLGGDGGSPISVISTPEDIAPMPTSVLPVLRAVDPAPGSVGSSLSSPLAFLSARSASPLASSNGSVARTVSASSGSSDEGSSNGGPSGPIGGYPVLLRTLAAAGSADALSATSASGMSGTSSNGGAARTADVGSRFPGIARAVDRVGKDSMQPLNVLVGASATQSSSAPLVLRSAAPAQPAGAGSASIDSGAAGFAGSPMIADAMGSGSESTWTTDAYKLLQREADGGGAPPATPAPVAEGAAPAAAGTPPGGSSTQSEADLELLAGRLYERLRYRIRREFLDDRERAGLVLDRVR